MTSRVDPLSATVVTASCLGLAQALGAAGFGLWFVASDLQQHTDEFDGLGVAIGLFLAVPAALALVLLGTAMVLLRRGARLASGVLVALVGLLAALALVPVVLGGDAYPPSLVIGITGLALLVSGTALAARRSI